MSTKEDDSESDSEESKVKQEDSEIGSILSEDIQEDTRRSSALEELRKRDRKLTKNGLEYTTWIKSRNLNQLVKKLKKKKVYLAKI